MRIVHHRLLRQADPVAGEHPQPVGKFEWRDGFPSPADYIPRRQNSGANSARQCKVYDLLASDAFIRIDSFTKASSNGSDSGSTGVDSSVACSISTRNCCVHSG